jgi:hypothetical protein
VKLVRGPDPPSGYSPLSDTCPSWSLLGRSTSRADTTIGAVALVPSTALINGWAIAEPKAFSVVLGVSAGSVAAIAAWPWPCTLPIAPAGMLATARPFTLRVLPSDIPNPLSVVLLPLPVALPTATAMPPVPLPIVAVGSAVALPDAVAVARAMALPGLPITATPAGPSTPPLPPAAFEVAVELPALLVLVASTMALPPSPATLSPPGPPTMRAGWPSFAPGTG